MILMIGLVMEVSSSSLFPAVLGLVEKQIKRIAQLQSDNASQPKQDEKLVTHELPLVLVLTNEVINLVTVLFIPSSMS